MEAVAQFALDAILLVLFVLCVVAWTTRHTGPGVTRAAQVGSVLVLILLAGSLSAVIVPAGNIGVVTAFGKVEDDTLQPGLHIRLPFVNSVHMITTRVQAHQFSEIEAASSEYQTVKLTGVMNYHLDGAAAADLYQRVGDDFADKILDPAFSDYIKSVVPDYSITVVLNKRDEIRQRAKSDLQANLSQYHIVVDDIYIANIAFSPEYSASIEAKQVAQQQVETEKQITLQRTQQAQQQVETAKGDATASIERARGQAEANRQLNASLTPALIQYTLIQKLGPDIKVMLLPSGQQFILDPNALIPTPAP